MKWTGESEQKENIAITWTRGARRSFAELIGYLRENPYSYPVARAREITAAINKLAHFPQLYPVVHLRNGKEFRRLVVNSRFLVYYIYFLPHELGSSGHISIRGVKHAAVKRPFAGVREPTRAWWPAARSF